MMHIGSALWPRPAWHALVPEPPLAVDPWPDAPTMPPRTTLSHGCHWCGLPRSTYEGHWCLFGGRETWRRWPS